MLRRKTATGIGEHLLYSIRESTYVILKCWRMVGRRPGQCNQCDGIANKEPDHTVGVASENTRCSPKHSCSHDRPEGGEQHAASCTLSAHTSCFVVPDRGGDATAPGVRPMLHSPWTTYAGPSSRHVNDPQPRRAGAASGPGSAIVGIYRAVPSAIIHVS